MTLRHLVVLWCFLCVLPQHTQASWYVERVYTDPSCNSLDMIHMYEVGRCSYDGKGGYIVYLRAMDALIVHSCFDSDCRNCSIGTDAELSTECTHQRDDRTHTLSLITDFPDTTNTTITVSFRDYNCFGPIGKLTLSPGCSVNPLLYQACVGYTRSFCETPFLPPDSTNPHLLPLFPTPTHTPLHAPLHISPPPLLSPTSYSRSTRDVAQEAWYFKQFYDISKRPSLQQAYGYRFYQCINELQSAFYFTFLNNYPNTSYILKYTCLDSNCNHCGTLPYETYTANTPIWGDTAYVYELNQVYSGYPRDFYNGTATVWSNKPGCDFVLALRSVKYDPTPCFTNASLCAQGTDGSYATYCGAPPIFPLGDLFPNNQSGNGSTSLNSTTSAWTALTTTLSTSTTLFPPQPPTTSMATTTANTTSTVVNMTTTTNMTTTISTTTTQTTTGNMTTTAFITTANSTTTTRPTTTTTTGNMTTTTFITTANSTTTARPTTTTTTTGNMTTTAFITTANSTTTTRPTTTTTTTGNMTTTAFITTTKPTTTARPTTTTTTAGSTTSTGGGTQPTAGARWVFQETRRNCSNPFSVVSAVAWMVGQCRPDGSGGAAMILMGDANSVVLFNCLWANCTYCPVSTILKLNVCEKLLGEQYSITTLYSGFPNNLAYGAVEVIYNNDATCSSNFDRISILPTCTTTNTNATTNTSSAPECKHIPFTSTYYTDFCGLPPFINLAPSSPTMPPNNTTTPTPAPTPAPTNAPLTPVYPTYSLWVLRSVHMDANCSEVLFREAVGVAVGVCFPDETNQALFRRFAQSDTYARDGQIYSLICTDPKCRICYNYDTINTTNSPNTTTCNPIPGNSYQQYRVVSLLPTKLREYNQAYVKYHSQTCTFPYMYQILPECDGLTQCNISANGNGSESSTCIIDFYFPYPAPTIGSTTFRPTTSSSTTAYATTKSATSSATSTTSTTSSAISTTAQLCPCPATSSGGVPRVSFSLLLLFFMFVFVCLFVT